MGFPSDLEIASKAAFLPLTEVAAASGIPLDHLEPYGSGAAKIQLEAIEKMQDRPRAKYVVVSAITPTPLGEGKTTTTVGLGMGFSHIGKLGVIAVRQPSMGPTFGIKGGAAGGGYSQVVPMELLNLHLTGDMHAVTAAHNMCSAALDAHLHHGNESGLDLHNITWRRVIDVNDRALRNACDRPRRPPRRRARAKPASTSPPPLRSWPHSRSAHRCRTCANASAGSSSATPSPALRSPPRS